MKKIFPLVLLFMLMGELINAQVVSPSFGNSAANTGAHVDLLKENTKNKPLASIGKESYLTKSRNQRTIGWCLTGAGVVVLAIGLASFPKADLLFHSDEEDRKANTAATVTGIGSGLLLGSIPFFILANVNKKRAALLSITNQKTSPFVSRSGKNITGLTLTIPVSK